MVPRNLPFHGKSRKPRLLDSGSTQETAGDFCFIMQLAIRFEDRCILTNPHRLKCKISNRSMPAESKPNLFISYARADDESFVERLHNDRDLQGGAFTRNVPDLQHEYFEPLKGRFWIEKHGQPRVRKNDRFVEPDVIGPTPQSVFVRL